jgi:hypothetical protein
VAFVAYMLGVMLVLLGFAAGVVKLQKLTATAPRLEAAVEHALPDAHAGGAGGSEATAQRRQKKVRRR